MRPIMSGGHELRQDRVTREPNQANWGKFQGLLPLFQLMFCELAVLLIAAIVAPSLLRSFATTRHAVGADPLHQFTTVGLTFSYSVRNIAWAVLGAVFGAGMAWAVDGPGKFSAGNNAVRMFQSVRWKYLVSHDENRQSYMSKAA